MALVFRLTKGEAIQQLDSLYLSNSPLAFTTTAEMIQYLADCFEEIDERANAIDQYALLR
jgi:hypothetical protein